MLRRAVCEREGSQTTYIRSVKGPACFWAAPRMGVKMTCWPPRGAHQWLSCTHTTAEISGKLSGRASQRRSVLLPACLLNSTLLAAKPAADAAGASASGERCATRMW